MIWYKYLKKYLLVLLFIPYKIAKKQKYLVNGLGNSEKGPSFVLVG